MGSEKITAILIAGILVLAALVFAVFALQGEKAAVDNGDEDGEDGGDGGGDGEETVIDPVIVEIDDVWVTSVDNMTSVLSCDPGNLRTNYIDDEDITTFGDDYIDDLRDNGGIALEYEHDYTGDVTCARVNITVTSDNAEDAYIFVTDGLYTYELVSTGFFGPKAGGDPADLTPATSLTFFGTAVGEYEILFELVELDEDTGDVLGVLAATIYIITVIYAP